MTPADTEFRPPHLCPDAPWSWRARTRLFLLWDRISPHLIVGILLLIFLLLMLWSRIVYTVGPGEKGVLFQRFGGTYMEAFEEGLHFISPIDEFYIYSVRLQEKRDSVVVLSNNGLDVRIMMVYRYHPVRTEVAKLHQQVGPNYEAVVVTPAVKEAVREVIGKYRPEEIYSSHCNIIPGEVFREALRRVEGKSVVLEAVIIENISLPPPVQSAIAEKHVVEQSLLAYEFKLAREEKEKQRKEIEAQGFQRYHELLRANLNNDLLIWSGIRATEKLAESKNAKLLFMGGNGSGGVGLPLILGNGLQLDGDPVTNEQPDPEATPLLDAAGLPPAPTATPAAAGVSESPRQPQTTPAKP